MELPDYAQLPQFDKTGERHAWEVWGKDDELGMQNLLTSERVRYAASLVRKGKVFNLDPSRALPHPSSTAPLYKHQVEVRRRGRSDKAEHYVLHGGLGHLDGLRHIRYREYGYYGGRQEEDLDESVSLGLEKWTQHGIVGRGVLIDWARYAEKNGQAFDPRERVTIEPALIEEIATDEGVVFQPGDILMLRTGWMAWWLALSDEERISDIEGIRSNPPSPHGRVMAGLDNGQATAEWLWNHQFSWLWGDNQAVEAVPAIGGDFQHRRVIAMFGMGIGELLDFEELARDCSEDGVFECMITAKPDNLPGLVGSPAHAYAMK